MKASNSNHKSVSRNIYLKVLAALILLVIGTFLFWGRFSSPTPDQIFNSSFEPYRAPTNFRGYELENMDEDFMLGLIKYGDGQYNEAILSFTLTLEKDTVNYTAKLLLAISHMAIKDLKSAEPILKDMVNDPSHLFQDQARWYLGLLYLVDENELNDQKANLYFDKIGNRLLREKVIKLR